MNDTVKRLMNRGVTIPGPDSIHIGEEVDPARIAPGVVIYPGCRILGKKTVIMAGAKIGGESPATIDDCQIGHDVELKGGFFRKSVFLDKSGMASGAHVRDACILEEEASGAHTVGLKQTILMPFVTLGSLINFCDCLMAGGTSRKDHSEVGSSYIHFNYTPNQDKATASLLGDVPGGVMLDRNPIFLGGQGGLVGPCVIGFGTVIVAGTVWSADMPEGGRLVMGRPVRAGTKDFTPGVYCEIKRRTRNNIRYIANIIALKVWYAHVRAMFFSPDGLSQALLEGALEKLDMALDERVKRLRELAEKMERSIREYRTVMGSSASGVLVSEKQELYNNRAELEERLGRYRSFAGRDDLRDSFINALEPARDPSGYIATIKGLPAETRTCGTIWLDGIVQDVETGCREILPSFWR